MNKQTYLNNLRKFLREKNVDKKSIDSIISDYDELYDEAREHGYDDDAIYAKLGKPATVYKSLKESATLSSANKSWKNKLVAVSPFIALIIFFAMTLGFGLPEYGWMAFLLIPITAIVVNVQGKSKLVALMPFVSLIVFMLTGFLLDLWHPMWLIFLLIPITAITLFTPGLKKLVALSPFAITTAYILIGTYIDNYFFVYGYVIFALIPVLAILTEPLTWKRIVLLITILLTVAAHQLIGHLRSDFTNLWTLFFIPIVAAILLGDILIKYDENGLINRKSVINAVFALVTIIVYLSVSLIFRTIWSWSWLILLLIPIVSIYLYNGFKNPVAYTPFVATIIFMTLGFAAGYWQFAWLAYLLIPIVGILSPSKRKRDVEGENEDEAI